jgi:hypothetical protein
MTHSFPEGDKKVDGLKFISKLAPQQVQNLW